MDHIVVDVEIQKPVGADGITWGDTDKMGIATAVVYEHRTDRFRVYGPDDALRLRNRLEAADRISGFNIWKFDFPVIYGLPGRERVTYLQEKTDDIFLRIQLALQPPNVSDGRIARWHKGWSLDTTARGTLGIGKIESGADAPGMFQRGEHARLINYCCDDVALERDLAEFVDKFGYVVNGVTQQVVRVPRWSQQVSY